MVNRTYGRNDEWRAHPVNREVTLKAGEFGTLEMTFFFARINSKNRLKFRFTWYI